MEAIPVTKTMLKKAFTDWQDEEFAGECLTPEEMAAMPREKIVEERVDAMWQLLKRTRG